jgi:hypothetical protein
MLFQHYNVSTNLSKKLGASFDYLQLQLGTPYNPFTLDYTKWGDLAPLLWTIFLWKSLHKFDTTLCMAYPSIPFPRERDKVIMEIILSNNLAFSVVKSISRSTGNKRQTYQAWGGSYFCKNDGPSADRIILGKIPDCKLIAGRDARSMFTSSSCTCNCRIPQC